MATNASNQYGDAYPTSGAPSKINPPDQSGDMHFAYFDFTVPSVAPSNNDIWNLCRLPAGARIVDVCISFPDLGTVGTVTVGLNAGTNGLETADASAFLTSVDVHTAADSVSMKEQMAAGGTNTGWLKKLLDEVTIQLKATTAWDATTGTVKGYVSYVTA